MKRFLTVALATFTSIAFGATTIPAGLINFNSGEVQVTNAVTPVTLFGEAAGTLFMAGAAVRSHDTSSHAGKGHIGYSFASTAPGTGTSGPLNADYAATFSLVKDNAQFTTQSGELDTVYVVARNGGPNSDTTAILGDVAHYGSGFSAFYEASISTLNPTTGAVTRRIDAQSGVLNNRDGTYIGHVVSATSGALQSAYFAQQTASASWSSAFQYSSQNGIRFDMPVVNGVPRIKLYDSSGNAKIIRANSNMFSVTNGDETTEYFTIDPSGTASFGGQLNAGATFVNSLTTSGTVNAANLSVSGSAAFTGSPTAATPSTADSSTKVATTAYVQNQSYAPKASPTFTGTPVAPTAAAGTNTTQIATTQYVTGAIGNAIPTGWTTFTPTMTAQSGTFTSASAVGSYFKIGQLVYFRITGTVTTVGSASGQVTFTLPFTANNGTGSGKVVVNGREDAVSGKMLQGLIGAGGANVIVTNYDNTSAIAAGAQMIVSGSYFSN